MEVKISNGNKTKQKPKSHTFFRMNITTMQMRVEGAVEKWRENGEEYNTCKF